MKNYLYIFFISCLFLISCSAARKTSKTNTVRTVTTKPTPEGTVKSTVVIIKQYAQVDINTHNVKPSQILDFAMKQMGIPYLYGSSNPKKGFDCSGFINYVFAHFNISVPRVTYMFTNAGVNIPLEFSKPGDIILFTDSDKSSGVVGHMGIITEGSGASVKFIHASSSRGVMISTLNSYFLPRYVKVNRIFIP